MNIIQQLAPKIPWKLRQTFTRKFRADGGELPRFYGLAYYQYDMDMSVCYPVPLHLVVRLWHWIAFIWLRKIKFVDWVHTPFEQAYRNGKRDGYNEGVASDLAKLLSIEIREDRAK